MTAVSVDALAELAAQRGPRRGATPTSLPWPDPLASEALYGPAGDFVRMVAPSTEADPVALLGHVLPALGCLIGHGPRFRVGGDVHTARLFVVLVGATARGRKGTALGWVRYVIDEVDPTFGARVAGGLSTGEGLIWSVRDPVTEWKVPKKGGDAELVTIDPGVSDKRLLIVEPEYARPLRACDREGSTLSPVLRLAWDGAELRILTKSQTATASGAFVSLISHVTLDELKRRFSEADIANGLGNRHLFLMVRRARLLPDGGALRPEDLRPFAVDLGRRVAAARRLGEIKRSPAAAELWREVYADLATDHPGMLGAIVARTEAQVLRLSLLYALLDASPTIEPVHLAAALAVRRYAEDSARYIFGSALGDPVADEIRRALDRAPNGKTRTELSDLFGRHVPAARLDVALDLLLRHRGVTCTEETANGGIGRTVQRWRCERSELSEERGGEA